jgi:hypothetical protein
MAISELITFNGGMSTKTSPHLIGRTEGIICENLDLERGTLSPLPSFQFIETVNGRHITNYNGTILSNQAQDDDRFYTEFAGRLYWSNNGFTDGLKRYDETIPDVNIGIKAEAPDPLTDAEVNQIVMAYDSNTVGRLTESGIYTYAFTIVDTNGIESYPKIVDSDVDLINKNNPSIKMTVSIANYEAWQVTHPTMAGVNVYRTGGDNPTFNLLAENISPTSVEVTSDATNAYWSDTIADINVSRIELTTFENIAPPDEIDMLIESKGTLWASWNKRVYYSQTGTPELWGNLDYVSLDRDCTGLGNFGDVVVAFTKTSAYIISGNNRDNVSLQRLPFNQGCISKHSIVNIDSYLVWASMNGICIFNGSTIEVITKTILAWDEFGRLGNTTYDSYSNEKWSSVGGFDIQYAVGYQDKYYGVYNNGIMIIDISNGIKVSTIYMENVVAVSYNYDDNFLYAIVDNLDDTYDVYAQLDGASVMTATWKTGRISEGSTNIKKHYRRVEIDGFPISVTVFIDGTQVFKVEKQRTFFLPHGLTGDDIQFEISTINEIRGLKYEYTAMKA